MIVFDEKERFRFLINKIIIDDNLCWLWQGWTDPHTGYGQIRLYGNKKYKVHRFIAYLFYGLELNNRKLVASHTCDVRECCNPAHIKVTTQKENLRDSSRRGRWHTGSYSNKRGGEYVNHLKQKDWGIYKSLANKTEGVN